MSLFVVVVVVVVVVVEVSRPRTLPFLWLRNGRSTRVVLLPSRPSLPGAGTESVSPPIIIVSQQGLVVNDTESPKLKIGTIINEAINPVYKKQKGRRFVVVVVVVVGSGGRRTARNGFVPLPPLKKSAMVVGGRQSVAVKKS